MNEIELTNEVLSYPESLLEAWKSGEYSMLTMSNASDYIKDILIFKSKRRPGRRFFGEAYIASRIEMKEGWYNSFKWLTADKWLSGDDLDVKFEKLFYNELMKNFGVDVLSRLQQNSNRFYNSHKERFMNGKQFQKPVAPDLWLIDREGTFKFIESKLPGDTIGFHQIAGLALISKYLRVSGSVSVSIMHLFPETINHGELFSEIYDLA